MPQCRPSIYKSYIEHIASNKALVVDDLIDYKIHIPFDPNYDIAIDTIDVNDDEIKTDETLDITECALYSLSNPQ